MELIYLLCFLCKQGSEFLRGAISYTVLCFGQVVDTPALAALASAYRYVDICFSSP